MKNTTSDNGAHTGLMINASQRVMFDPAGTFALDGLPERNDVVFGMTQRMETYYVSYHARETYYVIGQKIPVSQPAADKALALAFVNGPVPKAACTRATSRLLGQLPGFESIRPVLFPDNLLEKIAELPDVQTTIHRENDSDDKSLAAQEINAALKSDPSE